MQPSAGGFGLLVLDGLLLRRVEVAGRHAAELLGPGDLLRPFQRGDDSTLDLTWTWRVVAPTKCALLDPRWTARAAAWPQLGAELAGRGLARALRLVVTMAIAQQPKLDIRLWMLFWELADRYGKVHPDGIHLELPLTHEVLSHLAGARRPSVSGALDAARRGRPAHALRAQLGALRRAPSPGRAKRMTSAIPRARPSGPARAGCARGPLRAA